MNIEELNALFSSVDPNVIKIEDEIYKEEKLRDKMHDLMRIAGNNICVECGDKDPEWASVSLGIYMCITCSGIHRNLGVHISRVKSLFLDNWKREELEFLRDNGNAKSKSTWEHKVPENFVRPTPTDTTALKEQYIRAKYERKEFTNEAKKQWKNEFPHFEGKLVKRGRKVKNWKSRWCVLHGSVMLYFKKKQDPFQAGEITLKEAEFIDCTPENLEGHTNCFVIRMPGREFFVSADSPEIMYDWIQHSRNARNMLCKENPQGVSASETDVKEVLPKITKELDIQKRKYNKKTYTNCFIGASLVDWLVFHARMRSRDEATIIGKKLIDEGYIQSCTNEPFQDNESLYQFLKTEC